MKDLSSKDVTLLSTKLSISEENILQEHKAFMMKYPDGEMSKQQFVEAMLEKNKNSDAESAESLFSIFDEDESNTMDFMEFMMASNTSGLNSLEEKLNWIFNVFDKDGGGTIDPEELRGIVNGLFCMAGIEVPEEILEIRSKEMSEIIDIDNDGEITKEEFIKNAMTCQFICDMLQLGIGESDDEEEEEED